MDTSSINSLKRQLYTTVLKTVRESTDKEEAKILIKEQLDRQRLEHIADPTKGLMVDLFA